MGIIKDVTERKEAETEHKKAFKELKRLDKFSGREGPIVFIIMDGVGLGKKENNNAFFLAKTPYLDKLQTKKNYIPFSRLMEPQ